MSRELIWVLSNVALGVVIFIGQILELELVQKAVVGFVWVMLGIYLFVFASKDRRDFGLEQGRPFNAYVWWFVDASYFAVFMFIGWQLTAGAYAASCIVLDAIYDPKVRGL